jgi:hypothetical protein
MDLIQSPLKRAEEEHAAWLEQKSKDKTKWLKQSGWKKAAGTYSPTSACQIQKSVSRKPLWRFA